LKLNEGEVMKIKVEDGYVILEPHDKADTFLMGRISVNVPTKYDEITNGMKKEINNLRIRESDLLQILANYKGKDILRDL